MLTPWRKVMTKLESIFKSRDITLPTKVHLIDDFSSSHVWMWELEYKESWAPKNWCFWTVATWCKELTHLKRPWCWERLKAGGEGDNRAYGWMASSTPWTWVWVNSGSWWWTGRPGVLQSMGSQGVGHDWATEQQQLNVCLCESTKESIILNTSLSWCCFRQNRKY